MSWINIETDCVIMVKCCPMTSNLEVESLETRLFKVYPWNVLNVSEADVRIELL